jgi:hypothetical protein
VRNPSLTVVAIGLHASQALAANLGRLATYIRLRYPPPLVSLNYKFTNCTCAIAPAAAQARIWMMKYST